MGDLAVTLELKGKQTVHWSAPPKLSDHVRPLSVTIGQDPAGMGLEVAQVEWAATAPPTLDVMAKLHSARLGKRVCPVVVAAADSTGGVWLLGPTPGSQIVGPVPIDRAKRLLQSVLDQPSGLMARHRLVSLYDALSSTGLAGVANSGLFATNDLDRGARRRPDWQSATDKSQALLELRNDELLKALGYTTEKIGGNAKVLHTATDEPRAVAVLLGESEMFDASSARFSVSPVAYGLGIAAAQRVPWLIIARGSQIRLYPAQPHIGVGRKGQAETYFEVDLALLDDDTAGFLTLVFSGEALSDGGSVDHLLSSSVQYTVGLSERLRTKVYEEIVPTLSVAVAQQLPALGHELDRDGLDLAYQLTLRTFFRILFQAYAEDRKLLPYGENPRYDRNALNTVAKDLTENPDQPFDAESTSLWDDLTQVWRVIDKGDEAWSVPPYNGGLFSSDAELHPECALLDRVAVTNDVIGPALAALLIDTDDTGVTGPVDFRSLSVREFGTIYEGLLESNLALADVDLTIGKNDAWVPAGDGDDVVAQAGTVYFHNTSGQRKGTGSYFTPSFVVEHLLERALDPALDTHLERVAELLAAGDAAGAARAFFDFRVADLAMGSGHFLTAAIDHIEAKMAAFLTENDIPGVSRELRLLDEAARKAAGPESVEPEPSSLLRRQIARRCIYGLDVNPVAVELARVSIWIHTFVRGLPMSSLDHNLVCANSLTGIGSVDEALDVLVGGRKGNQLTVFDAPIEEALDSARETLADVAAAAEATRADSQAAAQASQQARADAETARLLFDAAVLRRIGLGELVGGDDPERIAEMARREAAQEAVAVLRPAHFPYLFPEVFLRERPGFDVLIGNPPWEKLHVEEHQWWGLRFPGLRSRPMKVRTTAIKRLQSERPDLVSEYEADIASTDTIRQAIGAGPYPGIGSGHIDLYKAFAWRNWLVLRADGQAGIVLPRAAMSGSGTENWRREVLTGGTFNDVCIVTNTGHWVFPGVDGRYTIAFVVFERSQSTADLATCGPFQSREEFDAGRDDLAVIPIDEFLTWTETAILPLIADGAALRVMQLLRRVPPLGANLGGAPFVRPVQGDMNASSNADLFDTDLEHPVGPIPVLTGSSFNLWDPDFGEPYAYADHGLITHLLTKAQHTTTLKSSAFFGLEIESADDLPIRRARIAFRDVARATDSRTVIAALLPPGASAVHKAPYLLRLMGDERDEAFLLGVLCSTPLDWYARRFVEITLSFQLLNTFPIPRPDRDDRRRARVIELAGRLAAVDDRYADWAAAVGVAVGSVTEAERPELIAELDALVAHLYGLDRDDVVHIFETFHRGWDYHDRLAKVLGYYDSATGEQS